jgi:transposase
MKIEDEQTLQKLSKISKNGKSKQERIRAHALILSNDGRKSQELATIFDVSQRTIFQWFKDFKETGLDSLAQQSGRGRKNKLPKDKYLEIVKKHIEDHPHQPRKAYALTLEDIDTTICYNTYKSFLKKHSISATNV